MTHSQYLLPGLPDLLKSHRLSYKKFLHHGIDEEFDLLSVKTELNEEELFYESLKLNYVDELSPSHVESLDYIYHPEEKIFLFPKRTLEDSLRGRQSHSFHLFVPLEVKILPFQDELDPTQPIPHFDPDESFDAESLVDPLPQANESGIPSEVKSVDSTFPISGRTLPAFQENDRANGEVLANQENLFNPQLWENNSTHILFSGGSGQPISEKKKAFFQAALNFFFDQSKIQEISLAKRFLLLRWFCEKIQHLNPQAFPVQNLQTLNSQKDREGDQLHNASFDSFSSTRQFHFAFAEFDQETQIKLGKIYQSLLQKFEQQTQKQNKNSTQGESNFSRKKKVKRFRKTTRWSELIKEVKSVIQDKRFFEHQPFNYPPFPAVPTLQRYRPRLSKILPNSLTQSGVEGTSFSRLRWRLGKNSQSQKSKTNVRKSKTILKGKGLTKDLQQGEPIPKESSRKLAQNQKKSASRKRLLVDSKSFTSSFPDSRDSILRNPFPNAPSSTSKIPSKTKNGPDFKRLTPERKGKKASQQSRKGAKKPLTTQKSLSNSVASEDNLEEFAIPQKDSNFMDAESDFFENADLFLDDESNFDKFGPALVRAFQRRTEKKKTQASSMKKSASNPPSQLFENSDLDVEDLEKTSWKKDFLADEDDLPWFNDSFDSTESLKPTSRSRKRQSAFKTSSSDAKKKTNAKSDRLTNFNSDSQKNVFMEFPVLNAEKSFDSPFNSFTSTPFSPNRLHYRFHRKRSDSQFSQYFVDFTNKVDNNQILHQKGESFPSPRFHGLRPDLGVNQTNFFKKGSSSPDRKMKLRKSSKLTEKNLSTSSSISMVIPTSVPEQGREEKATNLTTGSRKRFGKSPKTPKGFGGKRSTPQKKVSKSSVQSFSQAQTQTTVPAFETQLAKALSSFPKDVRNSAFYEYFKLPGFSFKKSGLTAGRVPSQHDEGTNKQSFLRFGQLETTKFGRKKLFFLQRIVKSITEKNAKKKKFQEIFLTAFPPLEKKKGLRLWKLRSGASELKQKLGSQSSVQKGRFRQDAEVLFHQVGKKFTHFQRDELKNSPKFRKRRQLDQIKKRRQPMPSLLELQKAVNSGNAGGSTRGSKRSFAKDWSTIGKAEKSGNGSQNDELGVNLFRFLRNLGKPRCLNAEFQVEDGPSKFLSLPQNELGSLWKIVGQSANNGFKRYQLQKLAYRQRNMLLLKRDGENQTGGKKVEFNRFVLPVDECQALHSVESFEFREKTAWTIEKNFPMVTLCPGLEFWKTTHSEKKEEEYWEAVLQLRREKLPSKLLVSAPTGDVVFVKSEKESQPRIIPRFFDEKKGKNSPRTVSDSVGLLRRGVLESSQKQRLKGTKKIQRMHFPSDSSLGHMNGLKVPTEKFWTLELMNMKFFTKKMVNLSPEILEFCWKYRFSFLWKALSESTDLIPGDGRRGELRVEPTKLALNERKNLPKVCSDLRKLLIPFYEFFFRDEHNPQKFFVSGQIGKKEWPIQKDGSKSYFTLLNLGKMPFMTKQGNFLINGSPRVLVSQIAKCPNFYTKMKIDSRGRPRYWTEFVSSFKNAGEWIQFHIDLENKMFFSLGNKKKYSIFIFLGALGISPPEIPDVIEHWDFLKQSIHKEEIVVENKTVTYLVEPLEIREARILFHDCQNYSFHPGRGKSDEELQKFFEDIFYNPARYFLGHAGREALNQRRRFSGTPSRSRALEKEDFLAAINALIEVRLGLAPPDDIDHLRYRRVRLPGELLQNEFHLALDEIFTLDFSKLREGPLPGDALELSPKEQRRTIFPSLQALEQKIFEKGRPFSISKTVGIQSTYQVSPLEKRMKNFFHTGQLSQYMDQTNPLAEITHKRRLTSLGPDGLPKQVGVAVRELHPSHFGRICPIETPEGLNAGLVASLSSQARIGANHTLLAPYYWVKDRTREFPQKIFQNEILQASAPFLPLRDPTSKTGDPEFRGGMPTSSQVNAIEQFPWPNSHQFLKYPPVLPEIIFLSAAAEDSVYICAEDYWFSSKYKNFETIANSEVEKLEHSAINFLSSDEPLRSALPSMPTLVGKLSQKGTSTPSSSAFPPDGLTVPIQTAEMDSNQARLCEPRPESQELAGASLEFRAKKWFTVDSKNSLVKFQTVFPARYEQEFFTVTKSQIDFFGICPTQMISVGTSLIPFLEHDDANRALMGSNMQRQALPLLVLQRPIVGTGSEKGVAQSSNAVLLSEFPGQVSFVDGRKIVVDSFPKTITSVPYTLKTQRTRQLLGSLTNSPDVENSSPDNFLPQMVQDDIEFSSGEESARSSLNRRNLFGKFQNRTEDGKISTIRRIFTVKIRIYNLSPSLMKRSFRSKDSKSLASFRSNLHPTKLGMKKHSALRHTSSLLTEKGTSHQSIGVSKGQAKIQARRLKNGKNSSKILPKIGQVHRTVLKIFPISDEEYEKSRTLLRREFIKKYKEIQKKKVFPLNFWPVDRWKKTGQLWEKSSFTQKIRPVPNSLKQSTSDQVASDESGSKSKNLPVEFGDGLQGTHRSLWPDELKKNPFPVRFIEKSHGVKDQFVHFTESLFKFEQVKRSRYKKPNLLSDTERAFRKMKFQSRGEIPSGQKRPGSRKNGVVLPSPLGGASPLKYPTPFGWSQSLLANQLKRQKASQEAAKDSPAKLAAAKAEKRRLAVLQAPLLKKKTLRRSLFPVKSGRIFFEPTPQMIFKNILSKNSKKREILRKAFLMGSFIKTSARAHSGKSFGPEDPHFVWHDRVLRLKPRVGLAPTNQKVSWSVSMKKVTPYTQVTYNLQRYWRTNQSTLRRQRPAVQAGDWVGAGDLLADSSSTLRGELCVGQNILVGYVPWEGYNFEDAIVVNERLIEEDIYTSILIDRYEMEASIDDGEKITRKVPDIRPELLSHLDARGIIFPGTWVEEDDILVGKILPVTTELHGYAKLLADIYQISPPVAKDVSFRVPDRISGRILECSVCERIVRTSENQSFATPWKVTLYLVEKRRLKLGDKMSGRHGNKGIVSIILPPQDMPFLPDGTPLDVALNPLGVPSRMNVGQLLESLLGLAGHHLQQKYRIPAFDEMYGEDFSRRLVYDKLLEASQKTQKPWLFNPNFPGKMMLRDGRTGDYLHQPILVGYPYMLKLIHMVDDKMHARATGPYTMVVQQPLKGRANRGGQRLGEMEVWAVEAFAASYALQELLTLKSDDITGRNHFLMSFLKRKKRPIGGIPDAFRVLMHELQSLCFHVHYTEDYRLTYPTLVESSNIPETPIPGHYGRSS